MSVLHTEPPAPDAKAMLACLLREGTPSRVHYIELYLDREVQEAIAREYHLWDDIAASDELATYWQSQIVLQRFLGYDYVTCGLEEQEWVFRKEVAADTAALPRMGGRSFMSQTEGPITCRAEFDAYPWPDPRKATSRALEYLERHLPDDMCVLYGQVGHFMEHLTWLMGYETLCYALTDDRDLVRDISDRLIDYYVVCVERLLEFERVRIVWGSDDMGFRSGTLISPADLREFVLPGHARLAEMCHAAGRPYILHSCGELSAIMTDLLDDVRIDGKHSYEDTILPPEEAKRLYGDRTAILGGIDVGFLCRADEAAVRARVRTTLDACMPGGGFLLGTGNSVANYIPLPNYLTMLDEGRQWRPSA